MFQQCNKVIIKYSVYKKEKLILIDIDIKKCVHFLNESLYLCEENYEVLQNKKSQIK